MGKNDWDVVEALAKFISRDNQNLSWVTLDEGGMKVLENFPNLGY